MTKFLNVNSRGIVEVPKEEFENILAKQEMYFHHAKYWQHTSYLLSLLVSRIPIDHQLLIDMLTDENNHLLSLIEELSGDLKLKNMALEAITESNCIERIKQIAEDGLQI